MSETKINCTKVGHTYPNGVQAIKDVDVTIEQGEVVSVVGQNGSGKTTLVKHFIARVSDAYGEPSNNDTFVAGYGNTTSAVDAIDFKFGSGNIDSGVIKLYGIK